MACRLTSIAAYCLIGISWATLGTQGSTAASNALVAGLSTTPPRLMLPIQGCEPMRVLILSLLAAALTMLTPGVTAQPTAAPIFYAGKTVLVTGSTDGLGREIARALAVQGAHVIVHGRNAERGLALVDEITKSGKGSAIFLAADFSSLKAVRDFAVDREEISEARPASEQCWGRSLPTSRARPAPTDMSCSSRSISRRLGAGEQAAPEPGRRRRRRASSMSRRARRARSTLTTSCWRGAARIAAAMARASWRRYR